MAWLGVIVIVGLVICGIGELRDFLRARKQRRLPPGDVLPPSRWTGRRLALCSVGGLLVLALVGYLVNLALPAPKPVTISTKNATTTTAAAATTTTTAPTVATLPAPGRPASQVHVEVLNGSGVAKAASAKAATLTSLGYPTVGTGNAPHQAGTTVACRAGFAVEALRLAAAVGPGTTVQPFPAVPPAGSATADCLVVLGK